MLFDSIHPVLRESIIWSICKRDSSMKEFCENVVNMISRISLIYSEKLCSKCGRILNDDVYHCMFDCSYMHNQRHMFLDQLAIIFGNPLINILSGFSNEVFLGAILGAPCEEIDYVLNDRYIEFLRLGLKYVSRLWSQYSEQ